MTVQWQCHVAMWASEWARRAGQCGQSKRSENEGRSFANIHPVRSPRPYMNTNRHDYANTKM